MALTWRLAAAGLAIATSMGAARAAEATLGLGYDGALGSDGGAVALGIGVTSEPLLSFGIVELRLGAAAEAESDLDFWAGFGPAVHVPLGDWRVEGSLMPGLYAEGDDGTDLGHPVEFRSRLGLGYALTPAWRAGFAFEHKSNAGLGDDNPGVETLFATVTRRF